MRSPIARLAIVGMILSLMTPAALGGVVLQFEVRSNREQGIVRSHAWLEEDRIRMQVGRHVMIFRGDKDVIWVIDDDNQQYFEMTREQMQEMGRQMSKMMEHMREQMENLPPEQRKMMEKMMAGKIPMEGQEAVSPLEYKMTGRKETINGFPCTSYEGVRDGRSEMELWITDWSNLGLEPADFKVFEKLADLFSEVTGPMAKTFDVGLARDYDEFPGVPIRTTVTIDDRESYNELKKVAREEIASEKFDVPAGYKKASMPSGVSPHGGR